jgi:hypothetical protein
MLGGVDPIVSTNIPLRRDGLPYADRRPPSDKGVAVYFKLKGRQMVFACDRWDGIEDNLHSIELTINALRGIERWGASQMLERAFTGFAALPAKSEWWEILGFKSGAIASFDQVKEARNRLAQQHHPDKGGNLDTMARINAAFEEARRHFQA